MKTNVNEAKREKLEQDAECVLNRMDYKGESLAEAIEAVTGASAGTPYGKKIAAKLGSK